jgi:gliding motility-associated lipoprotein GldB
MISKSLQRNQIYLISLLTIFALFFISCKRGKKHIDTSSIKVELDIKRFEKDLFSMDQTHFDQSLEALQKEYGSFYNLYFEQIVRFGSTADTSYKIIVKDFINNVDLKMLAIDCDSVYRDFDPVKNQLEEAFKHYKHYYPEDSVPQIVTFISGFNNGVVTGDGFIGVGLDMFMGKDYKFYPSIGLPQYIIDRLTKEHLLPTVMKGFASSNYELPDSSQTLLARIIHEGKLLYFIDMMLPETEDSLKIGYTPAQMQWCAENEANIWGLFLEENLLFSTDALTYGKYVEEAPFTTGLANDSAPRIGVWTGWQIVKKYMEDNPDITLKELMEETDYQKILKLSSYKPQ